MGPNRIVVLPPGFDHGLGFLERVEDLAIEQLVPQPDVEAFAIAILPWAPGFNVGGLRADRGDPVSHRLGHELGSIVGTNKPRNATQDEQVGEDIDDVRRIQFASDPDRQALAGEFVEHVGQAIFPPIAGAVLDEVVGPDVIGTLRPQPDAGSVRQP